MIFEISVNPYRDDQELFNVAFKGIGDLEMTRQEWESFRSLLSPSKKADFILHEKGDGE